MTDEYAVKLLRENRMLRRTLELRDQVIIALRSSIEKQNTVRHFLAASTVRNQNSASIIKPADAGAASPQKFTVCSAKSGPRAGNRSSNTPTSRSNAEAPLT